MAKRTRVLPPSEERRHFPRYQIHQGQTAHVVAHLMDAERCPAQILDLSELGITLLCDRRANPGEVVTLSLRHIPRCFECEFQGRVVYAADCQRAFLIGVAFTRELTDEEIAGLL
jgi:hypothetical protein